MSTNFGELNQQALSRAERIIGRVFSLAALAFNFETISIVFGETRQLDSGLMYASVGLIGATQLFSGYVFWFGNADKRVYLLQGAAYLVAFFIYPFSVLPGVIFPEDFRPWLWWATGTPPMAIGMFLNRWWSIAYILFIPISWVLLRIQTGGGSAPIGLAVQDGFYILLFTLAVISLVEMIKASARKVDAKNSEAILVASRQSAIQAAELERERLDDLVHDYVLTSLILASKAKSPESQTQAAASAALAIQKLNQLSSLDIREIRLISAPACIEGLSKTVSGTFQDCDVSVSLEADFQIPIETANSISDAMVQAITNSFQHAGAKAKCEVLLKADRRGLKVVIKDDGRGFNLSRVPKNRFGIRNSIRRRVIQAGGEVHIQSAPRNGTTVVLTWSENA